MVGGERSFRHGLGAACEQVEQRVVLGMGVQRAVAPADGVVGVRGEVPPGARREPGEDECAFVDELSEALAICRLVHGEEEGVAPAADTGITAERPDGAR